MTPRDLAAPSWYHDPPDDYTGDIGPEDVPEPGNAWPTPAKSTYGRNTKDGRERPSRDALARLWATPLVADGRKGAGMSAARRAERDPDTLTLQTRAWPTPIDRDWKSPSTAAKPNSRPLSEHLTGPLNPAWVELLMGFPLGWTDPAADLADWPGWPAPQGPEQYPYEPPRMVVPRSDPRRKQRIMTLGNAVVPAVGEVAGRFALAALRCEVRGQMEMWR